MRVKIGSTLTDGKIQAYLHRRIDERLKEKHWREPLNPPERERILRLILFM